jgi:CheY-like chemotaxis protein
MLPSAGKTLFHLYVTDCLAGGLELLRTGGIDLVLLDLDGSDGHGLDNLQHIHEQMPAVPMVVLSSRDDESLVLSAVRRGAQDYLVKQQVHGSGLARALCLAIERGRQGAEVPGQPSSHALDPQWRGGECRARLSHQLRTPLNGIIGLAELMHSGTVGPLAAQHQEFLGDILSSARHLLDLINHLFDPTAIDSGPTDRRPRRPIATAMSPNPSTHESCPPWC